MPETPEELYRRVVDSLQTPPVEEWDSWPFEGDIRPKVLRPPEPEPAIKGAGGADCHACTKPDADYIWTDDRWRLMAIGPTGLPVVVMLEPRAHHASPAALPEGLARDFGVMCGRVERAVLAVGGIERVHIGRWGEGAEHLHWWFLGRPTGFGQLRSSFAAIWDDVLPPLPQDIWEDNMARVAAAME